MLNFTGYIMLTVKKIIKKILGKQDNLVRVYSHPRSGTHFLEAFLAKNIYKKKNLNISDVVWGHWSNRKTNKEGNPFGKLFGNHFFPERNINNKPKIYIIRDGRAVAYSIWKTNNFIHKDLEGISFKEFLRAKIDWSGTPATKSQPKYNIIEHWYLHVKSWSDFAEKNNNILLIRYEDLVSQPYQQYIKIHNKFFSKTKKTSEKNLDAITKPVGLLPNKATKDSWKEAFDNEDLEYYFSIVTKGI
ncbi:sulfotransferase domain-containing protein [Olleya sp. R77988]|uniref:sulfotransferase domain-containing protein n=1 Tax=Olleya sp. R77988 TaxID=3093875 RepID=UPI0037CCA86C